MPRLPVLIKEVQSCTICAAHLPHGPRPVVQLHTQSRVLIAGQAPGRKVHESVSGLPFEDPSGDRLRDWMGVSREQFYDAKLIAILPMGFCYPGTRTGTPSGGDLPPRVECAPAWREQLLGALKHVELTLVIGKYAQDYHLETTHLAVTGNVRAWKDSWPTVVPLPHPSPRNNIWLRKNPWFEKELVPKLRRKITSVLS